VSDPAIWNRYWQYDRIASCFDDAGAHNYEGEIAAGWRAFFAGLPEHCRLLDLCTGNGAIAILAAETSLAGGKALDIVAVDQADIDPASFVSRHRRELETIAFHPATDVVALPFPDSSFEAVVSHYGLEYSDLSRSLGELARVAAPEARVRLVLHATEGVVRAGSERFVADADFLLETIDLPGTARRCFEALTVAERDPHASAEAHARARDGIGAFENALLQGAQHLLQAADKTMVRNCGAVLLDTFKRRAGLEPDQLVAKAEEVRCEIEAHRGRLQALIDAAVTREQLAQIADRLAELGAEWVETGELRQAGDHVGYIVEARFRS
jgi:SAM-dependent methyltransferase